MHKSRTCINWKDYYTKVIYTKVIYLDFVYLDLPQVVIDN